MSSFNGTAFGRRLTTLTLAGGLIWGITGCSTGSPGPHRPAAAAAPTHAASAPRAQLEAGRPLAELTSPGGLSLTITSARRDPAGYVTVRGDLANDSPTVAVIPAALRGEELKVLTTGPSLAGATLVDFPHHKRYYVLRDTDGRPLTTTGLSTLTAGESAHVFMQFPAPTASTVGFQLPLFDTANITIGQ